MNTTNGAPAAQPPRDLLDAMEAMRNGNLEAALAKAEAALADAADPAPYRALASLAALRMNRPASAVSHLRVLLNINPDDHASRINLATALVELGDLDGAMELVADRDGGDAARIQAWVRQGRGEMDEAIAAYRAAITFDPGDVGSWNNLANIYAEQQAFDAAIHAFERAITLAPRDVGLYLNLNDVLRRADRSGPRMKVMRDALSLAPEDRRVLTEFAMAQAHVDDLEGAIATLEDTVRRFPEFGESHIELGRLYETLNRIDDMARLVESVDRAGAPPEAAFLFAWRAQREHAFDEAAELAESIPESVHPMRRFHLIGQIAERRGDADAAFDACTKMNAASLADSRLQSGQTFRERVDADLARWTDDWAQTWPADRQGERNPRAPIFLVGFPRSGTTLLDTMLMGIERLSVLEERPMIAEIARTIGSDADVAALPTEQLDLLREHYFQHAAREGWDQDRWLVDKHPLNMARVPLILRLFPDARFILAERHPYDVVLSCFMANFQLNFAMRSFTTLEEAALTYDSVFRAWKRSIDVLPVAWKAVRYERLVENPRVELEPLIAWLGLDWDDRVLDHASTARSRGRVRTASYAQIGEELYSRATYRWRRYARHLEPVMPILAPWAEEMGYEPA